MSKKNDATDHHGQKNETVSSLKSAAEIAAERHAAAASGPSAVSAAEISQKELDDLRALAAKARENWDRLLRTQADLENYRKRIARERKELVESANEGLLLDLLTPLDHFEMGLQAAETGTNQPANGPLLEGMKIVCAQFQQFLKTHGVTEIQTMGQVFDPSLHEAVSHLPSDAPEGQIIQQIRKGYRFGNRLLRAAAVVVSKGKGGEAAAPPASPATSEAPVPETPPS